MPVIWGITFTLTALWLSSCGPSNIKKRSLPVEDISLSHRLTAEGDKLFESGKDYPALLKYLKACQVNPYNEVIFGRLARTYLRVEMLESAEKTIRRSIALNREYPLAYNTQGMVFLAKQKYKKAVRSFEKAIKLRPHEAVFYINLGEAYLHRRKFDEWNRAYHKAFEIDPGVLERENIVRIPLRAYGRSTEKFNVEREYQLARFFAELEDRESCLEHLRKALSAGFSDKERLLSEAVFDRLHHEEDFIELLNTYGINPQEP